MSKTKKGGIGRFILGAGIGVGLGMIFAPKSGKETRQDLKVKMDDLVEKTKHIKAEDVKTAILEKVEDLKKEIKNLDKETALDMVKEQAGKVKKKAEELVRLAVDKGTPVIASAAREVKNSTVNALEGITAKLKDEEEPKPKTTTTKKTTKTSK